MTKKSIDFKLIATRIRLAVLLILFGTLFFPFATGLIMSVKSSGGSVVTTYSSAFVFMFSGELISEHVKYNTTSNCLIALFGYIFIVLAFITLIVSLFIRRKKDNTSSILLFTTLGLILLGSILILCSHRSAATILADAMVGEHSDAVANTIYKNTRLGFGFWGVGIFGILSSTVILISLLFDGTIDKIRGFISSRK